MLVDAASGELHVFDPPGWQAGLPYPQPRDEPSRFRAEVMEPGESFDQTGFELPPAPTEDPAQPELFGDDFSQSDAADGEPVFWPAGAAQALPTDDSVQPGLSACSAEEDAPE